MTNLRNQLESTVAQIRALWHDRSGGTMVLFALTVPVILGVTSLGIDAVLWYMDKRILQTASDSGATAGAHVLAQGGSASEARLAVETEIARNDFTAGPGDLITVNIPPVSGPNAGLAGSVEVIVDKQRPLYFARFFRNEPTTIQARAVAGQRSTGGPCVLALDDDMNQALEFNGTADADINCGIASNSRSSSAIDVQGSANVQTESVQTYGDISVSGAATLDSSSQLRPHSQRVADPYADLELPDPSPCDETKQVKINNGTATLTPGRYCGGIRITGAAVTFEPGLYIIDDGDFIVGGNSNLTGIGVTFVLTADVASDIGTLKITGNAVADLSAPTDPSDPYAGVLFYQDRRADSFQGAQLIKDDLLGTTQTDLKGAVYFPNQNIRFSGGTSTGEGCLQLIARKVTFSGTGNILNGADACAALNVTPITQLGVALVE